MQAMRYVCNSSHVVVRVLVVNNIFNAIEFILVRLLDSSIISLVEMTDLSLHRVVN